MKQPMCWCGDPHPESEHPKHLKKKMSSFAVKDGDYKNSKGKNCTVTTYGKGPLSMSTLQKLRDLNEKKFPTNSEMELAYIELHKLLNFVDAWDACQTVTPNQMEKLSVLLQARKELDA